MEFDLPGGSANSIPYDGTSTWAARGTGSADGALKWLTHASFPYGRALFQYNVSGSKWVVVAPTIVGRSLGDVNGLANGAAQILKSFLVPAGLLRACSHFEIGFSTGRNNTTDTVPSSVLIGLNGTTGDTQVGSSINLSGSARSLASKARFILASATTIRAISGQNVFTGVPYPAATSTAAYNAASSALPDLDANDVYVDLQMAPAASATTPQAGELTLELFP